MEIIKDGKIVQDDWTHLADEEALQPGNITVSLQRWQRDKERLTAGGQVVGIRVHGEDAASLFSDDLPKLTLVCIDMPAMTDGRGFSLARLLRERHGYQGEIRVRGEFIQDQMYFLARVGVNAFEFPSDTNLETLLPALREFSVKYQAAADERLPLYRRR